MDQLTEVILQSVFSVLAIVIGLAFSGLKSWLMAKTGEVGVRTVEILATQAVQAVEQIGQDGHIRGKEKFEAAKSFLVAALEEKGINVSNSQLKMFIESAVKSANDSWESK